MKKSVKQKKQEKIFRQKKRSQQTAFGRAMRTSNFDHFVDNEYKIYLDKYYKDKRNGIQQKSDAFSRSEFYSVYRSFLDDNNAIDPFVSERHPGKFLADRQRQQSMYQVNNVMNNYFNKLKRDPKTTKKVMEDDPKTAEVLGMSKDELKQKLLTDSAFAGAFYRALKSKEFKETVYNETTGEEEEIEGFQAYSDAASPI